MASAASTVATVSIMSKINRPSFEKKLIEIIGLDVFDSTADRDTITQMDYQIPPWQRFPGWTDMKKEMLVDSIINNLPMSAIMLTEHCAPGNPDEGIDPYVYKYIQDGQTRLSILQEFLKDQFTWNGQKYSELLTDDNNSFNGYLVRCELIQKKPGVKIAEFDEIVAIIFERINSGKPLTASEKFHARKTTSVIQFIMELKEEVEFRANFTKFIGSIGEGKTRKLLADVVGVVLAIVLNDPARLTGSYDRNCQFVGGSKKVTMTMPLAERVRKFFRYYFDILNEVFRDVKRIRNKHYGKIGGPISLVVFDWLNANGEMLDTHARVWRHYFTNHYANPKEYEGRVFKELSKGALRNNTPAYISLKVKCVFAAKALAEQSAEQQQQENMDDDDETADVAAGERSDNENSDDEEFDDAE